MINVRIELDLEKDTMIASFNTDNTTKIGICYDFQLLQSIPHDKYDVKMDLIITESEVIV